MFNIKKYFLSKVDIYNELYIVDCMIKNKTDILDMSKRTGMTPDEVVYRIECIKKKIIHEKS